MSSPAAGTARSDPSSTSIGIVGGGIAGLYCAWHLLRLGYRVTLYELLDRLGGRIETARNLGGKSGFTAEFGPMRFEPEIQPLFEDLCARLGIKLVRFPPPSSRPSGRASSCPPQLAPDEHRNGKPLSTTELLELGLFRMFGERPRTGKRPSWLKKLDLVPHHKPKRWTHPLARTLDDDWRLECMRANRTVVSQQSDMSSVFWWELGIWNALGEELTHEAVNHIRDTGPFYHLIPDNPNAVEWAIFWLRLFQLRAFQKTSRVYLHTIKTGVYTIVERLEKRLKKSGLDVQLGHEVAGISEGSGGRVKLEMKKTGDDSAERIYPEFDHVILALPRSPLLKLSQNFPGDVTEKLDSVIGFPLLKAFLVVSDPWWQDEPLPRGATPEEEELITTGKIPITSHKNAETVPTRELHYFVRLDTTPRMGMVMLYTDHPATEFWKALVPKDGRGAHTSAAIRGPGNDYPRLRDTLLRYLGSDQERIEGRSPGTQNKRRRDASELRSSVVKYAIRDWSCEPFGAGCHAWKPGVQSLAIRTRLRAFGLGDADERGIKNVHICGEAYSDYQGFIEGALQTAVEVVKSVDGKCPVCRACKELGST